VDSSDSVSLCCDSLDYEDEVFLEESEESERFLLNFYVAWTHFLPREEVIFRIASL
jgi:hypothetical protein